MIKTNNNGRVVIAFANLWKTLFKIYRCNDYSNVSLNFFFNECKENNI